jgi:hypothetical protein
MHHGLNGVGLEDVIQFFRIAEIPPNERCPRYSLGMSCLQIVINDRRMASVEQLLHHMASDVSCASGDKDRGNGSLLSSAKVKAKNPVG